MENCVICFMETFIAQQKLHLTRTRKKKSGKGIHGGEIREKRTFLFKDKYNFLSQNAYKSVLFKARGAYENIK